MNTVRLIFLKSKHVSVQYLPKSWKNLYYVCDLENQKYPRVVFKVLTFSIGLELPRWGKNIINILLNMFLWATYTLQHFFKQLRLTADEI